MKKTRTHRAIRGLILLLCVLISPAWATKGSAAQYTNCDAFFDKSEFQEVIGAVECAGLLPEALSDNAAMKDSTSEDSGYKMFALKDPDFLESLCSTEAIADLLTGDYIWVVPLDNKTIKVNDIEGEWTVIGYSEANFDQAESVGVSDVVSFDAINELLTAKSAVGLDISEAILCFDAPMYHTSFVLSIIEDTEYLIPYGTRPDLTGLQNGTLYTRQQVKNILSQSFGANYSKDNNAGGGTVDPTNKSLLAMLGMSGMLLFTAAIVLYRIRKNRLYFP